MAGHLRHRGEESLQSHDANAKLRQNPNVISGHIGTHIDVMMSNVVSSLTYTLIHVVINWIQVCIWFFLQDIECIQARVRVKNKDNTEYLQVKQSTYNCIH
jgi:hypothetical protein